MQIFMTLDHFLWQNFKNSVIMAFYDFMTEWEAYQGGYATEER